MAVVLACVASTASAEDGAKAKPQPKPQPSTPAPAPAKPVPAARVTIEGKQALKKGSTKADVVKQIEKAGYLRAIERCYRLGLARSPGLRGKLFLAFQVTERGDTAAVKASAIEAHVDACVVKQAASWKLPVATDNAGRPTAAQYEIAFQLAPVAETSLEEESLRLADQLVADGGAVSGGDLSSRRPPSSDLRGEIGGTKVGVGGGGGRGSRGDGGTGAGGAGAGGAGATGDGPALSGPGATGNAPPATPAGRVTVADKQAIDKSSLAPEVVIQKILTAYMIGIKRCYKERLKVDPKARGRLALSFEVSEAGRLAGGKARGIEASLERCIEGLMATWRFPVPKNDAGAPIAAAFQVDLHLVPD